MSSGSTGALTAMPLGVHTEPGSDYQHYLNNVSTTSSFGDWYGRLWGGGSQMLPSCSGRLRNNVCIGILAGSLILSGAGCWAVWGPLIAVSAAGGATVVASKTRSTTRPNTAPAPDQTEAGRAAPASTAQVASARTPGSPLSAANPAPTLATAVLAPRTEIQSPRKPHSSRRHHVRGVVASRRSRHKKQAKLTTKVVRTASDAPGDLPPTSIVAVP